MTEPGSISWRNHRLINKLRDESGAEIWEAENPNGVKLQLTIIAEAKALGKELEARAGLHHPSIQRINEFEIDEGGTAYLVGELLTGTRVDERIARAKKDGGILKVDRAARIVEAVARALTYAHNKGVAHGDISTSRIYAEQEEVKLEFPVRARPDATPAGDVQLLGATFYEALCGEKVGSDPDVRKKRDDVPPTIAALVKHMLSPQPANRPSMNEVAESLLTIRGSQPTRRPAERTAERSVVMRAPARPFPKKMVAIAGAGVLGIALIGLIIALALRCPSGQHREDGQCMPDIPCPGGTAWAEGQCRSICKDDEIWSNGGCKPKPPPEPEMGATSEVEGVPAMTRVFLKGGTAPSGNVVEPFWIAKNETTVAAFRACGKAGECFYENLRVECSIEHTRDVPKRPMTCISFNQAQDFCKFVGGRLPTADEYEYAATGAGAALQFPWGNEPPGKCDRAWHGTAREFGCGKQRKAFAPYDICTRSDGNSPQGVCDLAGNVWEWLDETVSGGDRRVAGGSFRVDAQWLSPKKTTEEGPERREIDLGFRCVWNWP